MERKSHLFCYKKQKAKRRKFQQLQLFYSHATVLNVTKRCEKFKYLLVIRILPLSSNIWSLGVCLCKKKDWQKSPNLAVPTTSRLNKFSLAIFFLVEKVVLSPLFKNAFLFQKLSPPFTGRFFSYNLCNEKCLKLCHWSFNGCS